MTATVTTAADASATETSLPNNHPRNNSDSTTAACGSACEIQTPGMRMIPSKCRPRRICLFGTSANPPTGREGHAGVVEALVRLRKFDEVRVLPVYRHTFSSKRHQLASFAHRVSMCELAMGDLATQTKPQTAASPTTSSSTSSSNNAFAGAAEHDEPVDTRVVVSRAEEDSFRRMLSSPEAAGMTEEEKASLRVGTADLLEMLMGDEESGSGTRQNTNAPPTTEFSFCLGADTFLDLTAWKWKRSRDVLRLLEGRLVVVNRKQDHHHQQQEKQEETRPIDALRERIDEINATPLANGKIVVMDVPSLGDVSSSKVRNAVDKDLVKNVLSPGVFEYVVTHKLYGFGEDNSGSSSSNAEENHKKATG